MIGEGLAEADILGDLASLASAVGFAGFSVAIRRGRHTDMSPSILIAAAITIVFSGIMAAASGTGLAPPLADVGLATMYGVLVIGAGIFMLTIGARNVPAAELLVLSLTEVVFASLWVALRLWRGAEHPHPRRRADYPRQHRRPGLRRDAALERVRL